MRRYHLHLMDFGGNVIEDQDGAHYPSVTAARDGAIEGIREILGDAITHGSEIEIETVLVVDEGGHHVASVPVAVALPQVILKVLKNPVEVVPLERLAEYRSNADACRVMAENADDPNDKMSWLKLADAWLQMLPKREPHAGADIAGWPKATDEDSKASH
jgi:hypothetical protein